MIFNLSDDLKKKLKKKSKKLNISMSAFIRMTLAGVLEGENKP
jgi:plasmid stability protein